MRKSTKICAALGVVAGLGVAVAPLSVFAVDRTDTLNVNVTEACTIKSSKDATLSTAANNYYIQLAAGQHGEMQTYAAGSTTTTEAEDKIVISCNYAEGYKILANVTNPIKGTEANNGDATIPAAAPWTGGTDSGTSYWAAKLESDTTNLVSDLADFAPISSANQIVAHNNAGSAVGGDSFSIKYEVGISSTQKAGAYQGTVTYTLERGAN